MALRREPPPVFEDRREAGRRLGAQLVARLRSLPSPVVLGLPRGGVIVAAEVARALGGKPGAAPVARFGIPGYEEITLGAVAPGGIRIVNEDLARPLKIPEWVLADGAAAARRRLASRIRSLGAAGTGIAGRTVILVDDGLMSGASVRAAAAWCLARGVRRIIAAVPVARPRALRALAATGIETVCLSSPRRFGFVGWWYLNFDEVTIAQARAALHGDASAAADAPPGRRVTIAAGRARLVGNLELSEGDGLARGLVIIAHGSGSSRRSPRNIATARALNRAGFATLLLDLLTPREAAADHRTGRHRFDIGRLARRVVAAIDWAAGRRDTARLSIALLGASTGAAAALAAAARRPLAVTTVVSRGGRPDLARAALGRVRCPVLLIVGGRDRETLTLNRRAAKRLRCECHVRVVPGATHLFEEPGTLRKATRAALEWMRRHTAS